MVKFKKFETGSSSEKLRKAGFSKINTYIDIPECGFSIGTVFIEDEEEALKFAKILKEKTKAPVIKRPPLRKPNRELRDFDDMFDGLDEPVKTKKPRRKQKDENEFDDFYSDEILPVRRRASRVDDNDDDGLSNENDDMGDIFF